MKDNRVFTLPFPCRRKNSGEWVNSELGSYIDVEPIEWRVWQHKKSPQADHSVDGIEKW